MNLVEKRIFLKEFTKSSPAVDELIRYFENKFIHPKKKSSFSEKEYIKTWESYFEESKEKGAFKTLQKYIVPLQFPVKKGMSRTEEYINTTLRGKQKLSKDVLELKHPNLISLEIYESAVAGKIPVLTIPDPNDFSTVICALANKNEPKQLPGSMGALFINGINNWDRIHRLRKNWLENNPFGNWGEEFKKNILPHHDLYKDKLILLSTKPYSGIPGKLLGLSAKTWKEYSWKIRREHECTHLFTLQYYGCMANNIHDEIVADYAGITKVFGQFNKEYLMLFMGLEDYPKYREESRLQNYQQPIKLSKDAFDGLQILTKRVADTLYDFDKTLGKIDNSQDRIRRVMSICEVDFITMASSLGHEKLLENYSEKKAINVI